jgi:hypothetical protein
MRRLLFPRDDTLTAANAKLVSAQTASRWRMCGVAAKSLPLMACASSAPIRTVHAGPNPKYFGQLKA